MNTYTAFGLTIEADLPLPELTTVPEAASVDVMITRASLPVPPESAVFKDRYVEHSTEGTYFFWPGVGAVTVSAGRFIRYDALPECDEGTLRLPLLGICLGTLLHQRGVLTLHASAVAIQGRARAFIGWKGTGKSTTAAALRSRGHTLLTDDVLALDLTLSGASVRPAFPQLKLTPATVEALRDNFIEIPVCSPLFTKKVLRTASTFESESVPLECMYAITYGEHYACEPLTNRDAFLTVLSQTYAARFVGTAGTNGWHFEVLNDLLQRVPVYLLQRPRRLDELGTFAAFIEEHVFGHT